MPDRKWLSDLSLEKWKDCDSTGSLTIEKSTARCWVNLTERQMFAVFVVVADKDVFKLFKLMKSDENG